MINFSINRYWNGNLEILDLERGSYSLLFGYADRGPVFTPVRAKGVSQVYQIFGEASLLSKEYVESENNGSSEIWLVRINGDHCEYNIQDLLKISTLTGIESGDNFSYKIWDSEGRQYISIRLQDMEYSYLINQSSIRDLCSEINSDCYISDTNIYAEYMSNGFLQNYESEDMDKNFLIQGAKDMSEKEALFAWHNNIYDIIANTSPKIVGIAGVSFDSSSEYNFELFNEFNKLLIEKFNGTLDSSPIIGILPFTKDIETLKRRSNDLVRHISENILEENEHTERITFTEGNDRVRLSFSPIASFSLLKINDDDTISDILDGVCTIDTNYGIIEVVDKSALPITIDISYIIDKPYLSKLLCLTYNNSYSNSILSSSGVGILMGKVSNIGFDGSIRKDPVVYTSGVSLEIDPEDQPILKRNSIIYTKLETIGRKTHKKFAFDKTFYSSFSKTSPMVELTNINIIHSIFLDLSNSMELAFGNDRLIQVDLVVTAILEKYKDYINSYSYKYGIEQNNKMFQKSYYVDIDIIIDGVLEKIHLGYTL